MLPNFNFLGSLEVAQIYLPGWGGGGGVGGCHTSIKNNLSSQLDWYWTCQLELSLAIDNFKFNDIGITLTKMEFRLVIFLIMKLWKWEKNLECNKDEAN